MADLHKNCAKNRMNRVDLAKHKASFFSSGNWKETTTSLSVDTPN
jgi:hypothetical protein